VSSVAWYSVVQGRYCSPILHGRNVCLRIFDEPLLQYNGESDCLC